MQIEFAVLSTDDKYDLLKCVVEEAQVRDGNSEDYVFQDQQGYVNLVGIRGFRRK